MPATDHSPHTLVFTGDPDRIKGVGHFNDILHRHGLTSRLTEEFRPVGSSAMIVPVVGADGAEAVLRALLEAGEPGWGPEGEYRDGTFVDASRGVGHGLDFSLFTPPEDTEGPEWKALPDTLRRPVVALLDTGVRSHPWLPKPPLGDPFLIDAGRDEVPWKPELTGGDVQTHGDSETQSRAGHATFIAGIIRQCAPDARVLSIRVMNDEGRAQESTVHCALHWLLGYIGRGNPVDVLCMAFGRRPGDETDGPLRAEIDAVLAELAGKGVQAVASAGNDHTDADVYPASSHSVVAVGVGFSGYHAEFSNFGEWVKHYRDGVDVESILPGDKWARWSGTSFAAANFAADLARRNVAR